MSAHYPSHHESARKLQRHLASWSEMFHNDATDPKNPIDPLHSLHTIYPADLHGHTSCFMSYPADISTYNAVSTVCNRKAQSGYEVQKQNRKYNL